MPQSNNRPVNKTNRKPAAQAGAEPTVNLGSICQDLNMPPDQVLAWKIYPDRVVILFKTGQKLARIRP